MSFLGFTLLVSKKLTEITLINVYKRLINCYFNNKINVKWHQVSVSEYFLSILFESWSNKSDGKSIKLWQHSSAVWHKTRRLQILDSETKAIFSSLLWGRITMSSLRCIRIKAGAPMPPSFELSKCLWHGVADCYLWMFEKVCLRVCFDFLLKRLDASGWNLE